MATNEEIAGELEIRIKKDLKHFNDRLPEPYALAWHGYIAGLYEWGIITQGKYMVLFDLLPRLPAENPVADIFAGRD